MRIEEVGDAHCKERDDRTALRASVSEGSLGMCDVAGTCDVAAWFPPAALRNAVWAGKTNYWVGLCEAVTCGRK